MPRILISFFATFAVALGVFVVLSRHDGRPASTANPDLPHALRPSDSTDVRISKLQATVRAAPLRADGWTLLAGAYLQKVRETGDAGFYVRAQGAVSRALSLKPGDAGALTQLSALELSRHDFRAGLADAERARAAAPMVDQPFGTLVDALVELGRYDQAGRTLQEMVDRKPDLAAYARVSYFRELHGDLPGALSAMRAAVSAGGAVPEQDAYVRSLLGGLELQVGQVDAAVRDYRGALTAMRNYPAAEAGLAQADVARGRLAPAIARLKRVVAQLPLPQYVIALGEAQAAAGHRAAAQRSYALVRAEVTLQQRAGVNADVELALFEADHGSPSRAVALGRRAWAAAPSVRSADALGWALHSAGHARAALGWARRALALGSRDPAFLAHAGLIARGAGHPELGASWLARARAGRAALGANLRAELAAAPRGAAASPEAAR
jgi:tetratricopeptide (TPR) repeat protein